MKRIITLAALLGLASTPARADQPVQGIYAGTLGTSLAVTLSLGLSGTRVHGYYHYDKTAVDIRITGQQDSTGTVSFDELGVLEVTGHWTGQVRDGRFSGQWTSGDGARTLPFSLTMVPATATPGQPIGKKVTFGAKPLDLPVTAVAVPKALAAALVRQMDEDGEISLADDPDLKAKASGNPSQLFTGEAVNLDDHGQTGMVVRPSGDQGACTAANCSIWVFRGQTEILHGLAGIGGYSVIDLTANGLHGIALSQHVSASETEHEFYQFDGRSYALATCITEIAKEGRNGNVTYVHKEHACPR